MSVYIKSKTGDGEATTVVIVPELAGNTAEAPLPLGDSAILGGSANAARADHVHKKPTPFDIGAPDDTNTVHIVGDEHVSGYKYFDGGAEAVTLSNLQDSTAKVATTAWVHNYVAGGSGVVTELDENLVHKNVDNEVITGSKIFSKVVKVQTPLTDSATNEVSTTEWVRTALSLLNNTLESYVKTAILNAHPVGSYYMSEDSTSPAVVFGGGVWERVQGRVLIGADDSNYVVSSQGGSSSHTISANELPQHSHSATINSAGSHAHTATATSAGDHSHDKGSMRIQGSFGYVQLHQDMNLSCSGPFYEQAVEDDARINGAEHESLIGFDTDRGGWTGSTSSSGGHSHSVSVESSGSHTHSVSVGSSGGGAAMSVMNPYRAVYIWRRTA